MSCQWQEDLVRQPQDRGGKAKYLGGVGKKTTGVSRRTFKPNLQRIHIWLPNGTTRYVRVATSVIRSGELTLEVDGKMQTFPLIKAAKGAPPLASGSRTSSRSDQQGWLARLSPA